MYKKINGMILLVILGSVLSFEAIGARNSNPSPSKRVIGRAASFKANIARTLEVPCSSRNIAENGDVFLSSCAMSDSNLASYTMTDPSGVKSWDPSKIYVMAKSSKITPVMVQNIPVNKFDKITYNQWVLLWNSYRKIIGELDNLMSDLDGLEGSVTGEDSPELQAQFEQLAKKREALDASLSALSAVWQNFIAKDRIGGYTAFPNTTYPMNPEATSPYVSVTNSTQSQPAISESFYSDFKKFLDNNPQAHLQMMKYNMITEPVLFTKFKTQDEADEASGNKVFYMARKCADTGPQATMLRMTATFAPPLLGSPIPVCLGFSSLVVRKTADNS